jgi:tetratricopeptide (TPR) repeat protein
MNNTPLKSPLAVAAIQLGLLLFAIYYTLIGGQTAQGIYDPTWRAVTLWLTTTLLGLWLLWRLVRRARIPRTPLDLPLLFLLVAWALAALFSVNPVYSQETLVFFLGYLFFFYLAADLGRRPWFIELSFNAIIAVAGLVWMLALLQLSWWYRDYTGPPYLLQGVVPALSLPRLSVLGNPNTMASYIALVLPLVLYKFSLVRKNITRLLLGLWLAMLAGAILLTQSRGGWLAFIVAVSFYLVVWLRPKLVVAGLEGRLKSAFLQPTRLRWFAGLAVAGLIGLFIWLTLSLRGFSDGLNFRQEVMSGALKTLLAHPILGAGPGTLGEELIRRQQPLSAIWADAHNLLLTIAAETGLVGLIGLIWLGLACFKLLKTTFRSEEQNPNHLAGAACAAALLGFAAHNMVDYLFKFPLMMILVAGLAGFWVAVVARLDRSAASRGWPYPAMAAAGLALIVHLLLGRDSLQHLKLYQQAVESAGAGNWPAAAGQLRLAQQLAPATPFYRQQLAFALGQQAQRESGYRQEAIAHYQAALQTLDRLSIDHANLGCLLWAEGRQAEAIREMDLAVELQPFIPLYRLNLAYYLESTGNEAAAQREYAYILATWPNYLQSDYWFEQEQRAALLPQIVQQAVQDLVEAGETGRLNAIQLQLEQQEIEAAQQLYDRYLHHEAAGPLTKYLAQGKILLAQGQLEPARTAFEAALRLDPKADAPYLALSRLALASDEPVEAAAYAEAALFLNPTPAAHYQAGLAAEAAGDPVRAIEQYEAAFTQLTTLPESPALRYATEVARRRPLPESYLPCLKTIYPTRLLVAVTQAEGHLLEKQGQYEQAGRLYRRLLNYEPFAQPVAARLEILCQDHLEICEN